jgi:MFS family permease
MGSTQPPGAEIPGAADGPVDTSWRVAIRALRHRDFALFWVGMIVSVVGTWMQMMAQGWLVFDLTHSKLYLGIVAFCGSLPMFCFTLFAGPLADRFRKRNIVLVTQTLAMLQAFALAALVYTKVIQVWHVMVLAAVLGTINAFDMPTRQAMVLELVRREDGLNAVSLNSSAFNAGRIIGPAISGPLIEHAGIAGCFFINGLSFLAIILALLFIPARPPAARARGGLWEQIRDGMAWVKSQPVAMGLLFLTAVSGFFAMPYATLMPAVAKDVFHKGASGYGLLLTCAGIGALSSALLLTSLGHRWRLGRAVVFGAVLFPLALVALAAAPTYHFALVAIFLVGVGLMMFNAVSNSMLQTAPPDSLRGRVMSLRAFVFSGMTPFGSLQIGKVAEAAGPRLAIGTGGVICLLSALIMVWRVPQLWRRREAEVGQGEAG